MPASSARAAARVCSAGSPLVIKPPIAPQPNPSAETVRPVRPRGRRSMPRSLPAPGHQLRNADRAGLAGRLQALDRPLLVGLRAVLAQLHLALEPLDLDLEADHVLH